MSLCHFITFFLLEFVHISLGKQCIGCPSNIDINNEAVHDYLSHKLHELKNVIPKGVIDDKKLELIRVTKAQQKVVSGVEYFYQFEAKGLHTNHMYNCNLKVLRQPWLGLEKVSEYSCNLLIPNENQRLLPQEIVIDAQNNNELEELKSFISQEIGKVQRSEYLMTVIKYLKATKKIIEGMIIKTTVKIGITNCHLNTNIADTDCQYKLQGHQICDVQVWLKPWMKFKEVIDVQCQPLQSMQGVCVGCPIEKDPNSVFIKQSLEKTLHKLNEESHASQKLALVKINKATSQIINGFKLTVYFDAREVKSNKNYTCKTIIILPPSSSEEPIIKDFNCTLISAN